MRYHYAAFFILFAILFSSTAHAQNFSWVKNGGQQGTAITTDASGNAIVAGFYAGTGQFGSAPALSLYGFRDGYVAKYDANGTVMWARGFGGNHNDFAAATATDASGNVYVSGYFLSPSLRFTPTDSLTLTGSVSLFLAKYSSTGVFQWARKGTVGGANNSTASALRVDAAGDILVGGVFSTSLSFAGAGGATPVSVGGGSMNLFLYKFSPAGAPLWGKAGSSSSMCALNGITTDAAGNIYATGKVSNPINWGTGMQTVPGGDQMIVAKFNNTGVLQWMQNEGKSQLASATANVFDCGNAIAVDASGNIYVGGSLLDTSYYNMAAQNVVEWQWAVITKYSNAGVKLWQKRMGGKNSATVVNGLALDVSGNPYITGTYKDTMSLSGTVFPSAASPDAFIARLTPAGMVTWFRTAGGPNEDAGNAIAIDGSGNAIVTGAYKYLADFGTISMMGTSGSDSYVAKLGGGTAGLSGAHAASDFVVWPNPAGDILCFFNPLQRPALARITDAAGRMMLSEEVASGNQVLDLRALAPGLYNLTICSDDGECYANRVVKK
jgi:hypothetical protein